jgi:hypothetical protein
MDWVFDEGLGGAKYQIADKRILQKLFRCHGYDLEVVLYRGLQGSPSTKTGPIPKIDFISIAPPEESRVVSESLREIKHKMGLSVAFGELTINVFDIIEHVNPRLASPDEMLSITKSSERVWGTASRNMKAAIHNWMSKGGIFMPAEHKPKSHPGGCRLSRDDQVVVGLLYSLFSFGLPYAAIKGETAFFDADDEGWRNPADHILTQAS